MKLLVDCHCFDFATTQGINTYIRGLYGSLIPIAKNIEFYLTAADTHNLRQIFGTWDNVHYVEIPNVGSLSRLIRVFPKIIKRNNIDWAHFQYVSPLIKNCKTIITLHDILFKDFPQYFPLSYKISKGLLFEYSAKKSDLLLTVSEYSKSRIVKHFNINKERIHVTPNAVTDVFGNLSRSDARYFVKKNFSLNKYILYVSRLEPRKDQFGLIQAYIKTKLYIEGIDLVIVGDMTLRDRRIDELKSKLDQSVSRHTHFLSGINDNQLHKLFIGASLFVYPSKAEGFGIPPLEAAVAKIPVICNNATAMRDFDFFCDSLTDTSDTDGLARNILSMMNHPMSENALLEIKKLVMDKYNWEYIALDYYNILKNLN